MRQIRRYAKFIVSVIGAIGVYFGVELDEAAATQMVAMITAVLVYAVPNR